MRQALGCLWDYGRKIKNKKGRRGLTTGNCWENNDWYCRRSHGAVPASCPPVHQDPLGDFVGDNGLSLFRARPSFLPLFSLIFSPLFRTRGPALQAEVLELVSSAFSDTPTAWPPYPATVAPLGDRPVGCCTATTASMQRWGGIRETLHGARQSVNDRRSSQLRCGEEHAPAVEGMAWRTWPLRSAISAPNLLWGQHTYSETVQSRLEQSLFALERPDMTTAV